MNITSSRLFLCLLFSSLIFNAVTAQVNRLGNDVQPLHQSLEFELDPSRDDFRGQTTIRLKVVRPVAAISVHATQISIDRAILGSRKLLINSDRARRRTFGSGGIHTESIIPGLYSTRSMDFELGQRGESGDGRVIQRLPRTLTVGPEVEGKVSLQASSMIAPGNYTLQLEFHGPFSQEPLGLYKFNDQEQAYLVTQFEPTFARQAFPCFDEPGFKIPYQVTVIAPRAQQVFSNTPEVGSEVIGPMKVHRFAETPPLPSYLIALAVGPYETTALEGLGVPARLITPSGKLPLTGHARRVTPIILEALEDYFAMEYPYQKLDQIAVTEHAFGAMENNGLATYGESVLLVDAESAPTSELSNSTDLIAHELAHHWFGNLVTMKWWNDLWLNEAFATWMAAKIVAEKFPEWESDIEPRHNEVMDRDASSRSQSIRHEALSEDRIFNGLDLAYHKGEALLSMVERWVGEETFREGLNLYIKRHRFSNAEASDLWGALGEVSSKDVQAVLSSFTDQPGYPLISMSHSGTTLRLSQTRFHNFGEKVPQQTWSVPLAIRYGDKERVAVLTTLLKEERAEVELLFEPDWVIPDGDGIGYFRWMLSPELMNGLLANETALKNREKLALLHNAYGLFRAGQTDAGESLRVITSFIDDDHPMVVGAVLERVQSFADDFVDGDNREPWIRYLTQTLAVVEQRYGLEPRPGEHERTPTVRSALVKLKGMKIRDEAIREKAASVLQRFLAQEKTESATLEAYLEVAAFFADAGQVASLKTAYLNAADPNRRDRLRKMLGSLGQAEAQAAALDLVLDKTMPSSDLWYLLYSYGRLGETSRYRLLSWLEKNHADLKVRMPDVSLARVLRWNSAGAHETELLNRLKAFYGAQEDPDGRLKQTLDALEQAAERTRAERRRGRPSFDSYLNKALSDSVGAATR